MAPLCRLVLQRAQAQWRELDAHLAWCDERIATHAKENDVVKAAGTLIGIGPVAASAAIATVVDFRQFKFGAQFGAWLGLVPSQHSSTARCEWSPAERFAFGYARAVFDHVQQGRLHRSNLFLVHTPQRHRLLIGLRPTQSAVIKKNPNTTCQQREVSSKGLGRNCH